MWKPRTVMTSSTKSSEGNVSSQSRRTCGSALKSEIRVPLVMGVANSMVFGAKLMAVMSVSEPEPEKNGVGTVDSRY